MDATSYMVCTDQHTSAQVNDFSADAVVSQLLLLDAQDPVKVGRAETALKTPVSPRNSGYQAVHQLPRGISDGRHGNL